MMGQNDWNTLFEAFNEEEPFWENNYADESNSNFKGLNLCKWLECDGNWPSRKMMSAFALHGYDVFPIETDSSGWLIGGVRRMLDPTNKVITFG